MSEDSKYAENPLVKLLAKGRKNVKPQDVVAILAAIAKMGDEPFTLTELDSYIPNAIKSDKHRRRSISTLLETLVEIGYLRRPTERKWQKTAKDLSSYISTRLFELFEAERTIGARAVQEEKVIKTEGTLSQLGRKRASSS